MQNHGFLRSTPTGIWPKPSNRVESGSIGPWIPDWDYWRSVQLKMWMVIKMNFSLRKSLLWKISELRFFGLTKDLAFRFQFWYAGIIKIIPAKYQWLQIFQFWSDLTFRIKLLTSRISSYSMTSWFLSRIFQSRLTWTSISCTCQY